MKSMYLLILMMTLVLGACEAPDEVSKQGQETDSIKDPICNEASTNCDMDWVVTYPRENFPNIIQILINDKVIFTECGDTQFVVNRYATSAEIMMWNYRRLAADNKTKFSFEVKSVADCNDLKTAKTFDLNNPQLYKLEEVGNTNRVIIRN